MTLQTQLVLRAMLDDSVGEHYGLQLRDETGLPSGTIYPILARLERCGWVASSWEDPMQHILEGRPRRRYYQLTGEGAERARDALARISRSRKRPYPGPALPFPAPSWTVQ